MKIGYVMQQGAEIRVPPFDGPAVHVREIVRELIGFGHQVRVLVQLGRDIWRTDDLEHFTPVRVPRMDEGALRQVESVVRRVQHDLKLPYAAWFESRRFAQACVQELEGFDLIYERSSWVSYGGALAAHRLDIPLVLENNGDHLADLEAKGIAPQGAQRRISTTLMGRVVGQAAHVVVTGDGWRDAFIRRWGKPTEQVTLVENGTALVRMLPRDALRSFQPAPVPASAEPVRLVYLGGFQPWQGVEILLRALAEAPAAATGARLTCIGSGARLAEMQQLAADLNLAGRVAFTSALPDTGYAPLLAGADIGVAPYCGWPEYSGLKLFDYKAAGLAVVASGEGGRPRTLAHGETAWITPPCDGAALGAAIAMLADDPALRRRLGQAARLEAEQKHGWDATARQLEAIFVRVTTA
jgi:glycosyltransferase involved in cell wall biosynthesis